MRGMASYYRAELEALDKAGELRHEDNGVRVHVKPVNRNGVEYVHLRMWAGKRSEADYNYLVKPEEVEDIIAAKVKREGDHAAYKKKAKAEARSGAAEMAEKLKVGTLLHGSWGYDQTNVELYEIVERPSPRIAVIRPIKGEHVRATGPMAEMVKPCPGEFCGEPIRKRINAYGVRLHDHCNLSPTSADSEHYSSWYH